MYRTVACYGTVHKHPTNSRRQSAARCAYVGWHVEVTGCRFGIIPAAFGGSPDEQRVGAVVSAIFYGSQALMLVTVGARSPNSVVRMLGRSAADLRQDRAMRRSLVVVLVGQAGLPLFVWLPSALGPAATTAIYELWPVALAVMCSFSGRGLRMSRRRFTALCCMAVSGVVLVTMAKEGVWSTTGSLYLVPVALLMPVLSAAYMLATLRYGERASRVDASSAPTSTTVRAWNATKPALVPVIIVDVIASILLGAMAAVDGTLAQLDLHSALGAVIAGAVVSSALVALVRMGNVAEGRPPNNLILVLSPMLSLVWLMTFVRLELTSVSAFLVGAAFIVISAVGAQSAPGLSPGNVRSQR